MAILVVEFSSVGYKIRESFAKESTYQKEMIEFLVLYLLQAVKNRA